MARRRIHRARGAPGADEVFFTLDMSPVKSKELRAVTAQLDASRLRYDEPVAPYTTFKIGGPADVFYDASSADDLAAAVLAARTHHVPHFVLGLGANILVGD